MYNETTLMNIYLCINDIDSMKNTKFVLFCVK